VSNQDTSKASHSGFSSSFLAKWPPSLVPESSVFSLPILVSLLLSLYKEFPEEFLGNLIESKIVSRLLEVIYFRLIIVILALAIVIATGRFSQIAWILIVIEFSLDSIRVARTDVFISIRLTHEKWHLCFAGSCTFTLVATITGPSIV
jgi:hypothetical protein